MADLTVQEIVTGSACYSCVDDQQAALLYIFDQVRIGLGGDIMTVQEIVNGSACFDCVDSKMDSLLFLSNEILAGGGGGATCLLCGIIDPVAVPACPCALYYNTANASFWYWDNTLLQWFAFIQ